MDKSEPIIRPDSLQLMVLTLTKYDGYDPEVGSNGLSRRGLDFGTYPISIQMRGGFQLNF